MKENIGMMTLLAVLCIAMVVTVIGGAAAVMRRAEVKSVAHFSCIANRGEIGRMVSKCIADRLAVPRTQRLTWSSDDGSRDTGLSGPILVTMVRASWTGTGAEVEIEYIPVMPIDWEARLLGDPWYTASELH